MYEYPPILRGDTAQQLSQLRDYLVRMARTQEQGQTAALPAAADTTGTGTRSAAAQSAAEVQKHTDALRALIVKTAKQQQSDKAELQEAIDGVEGTTLLHIDSSRGTVFKHSAVETRLTVVLYRGGERITDAQAMRAAFGSGAHLQWSWRRMGEERYGVISAGDSRLSDEGFTLTLGPQDVDTKVTFACELLTA